MTVFAKGLVTTFVLIFTALWHLAVRNWTMAGVLIVAAYISLTWTLQSPPEE